MFSVVLTHSGLREFQRARLAVSAVLQEVAVWAGAGFLVSIGWGLYFAMRSKAIPIEESIYVLARLTQPAVAAILYIKPGFPLGLIWVAVANAASYAVIGSIVEKIKRHPVHLSNHA